MTESCFLDKPYPKVEINEKNREKGLILLPAYAGTGSELTAINDYSYQSLIVQKDDSALYDTLECIALTEMKHFHILGEIIYAFGVLPKLYSNAPGRRHKSQWWNGSFVDYTTLREIFLRENIRRENEAIKLYATLIDRIENTNVEEILERIILDERHHIEIFESFLQ